MQGAMEGLLGVEEGEGEDGFEGLVEPEDDALAVAEASRYVNAADSDSDAGFEEDMSLDDPAIDHTSRLGRPLFAAEREGAEDLEGSPTVPAHSRHLSRLSLRSVGGASAEFGAGYVPEHQGRERDEEVGEEWTGSEDVSEDEVSRGFVWEVEKPDWVCGADGKGGAVTICGGAHASDVALLPPCGLLPSRACWAW